MTNAQNYFSPKSAAERYARGRPSFHPLIVQRIKEFLTLKEPLRRVLDVGCGTGLSSIALTPIAREIIGLDASREMIAFGPKNGSIKYVISNAENLPFAGDEFDLITISQAFHWFARDRFLSQANRVLRTNGWLVVYDNYFSGQMKESDKFGHWHEKSYLIKYPSPHRPLVSLSNDELATYGFRLVDQQQHRHAMSFSIETLIDYLVTQSNVIAAVEVAGEEIGAVRWWMRDTLIPIFGDADEGEFVFNMPLWFLQRTEHIGEAGHFPLDI